MRSSVSSNISICAVFLCIVVLYWPYFPRMITYWNDPENNFIYLVFPVFIYFLWTSRWVIVQRANRDWRVGFLGLFFSMIIMLIGKFSSLEVIVYISLWSTLLSMYLVVFGACSLKQALFPFCLLAFAIPLPAFVVSMVSFKLKIWSSTLAVSLLQALSIPVFRNGNIIDLGVTQLQVVDACSGLRYLIPSLFLALLIGKFFLNRITARFVLAAISPLICIAANSLRLALTGILVRYVHPGFAEGIYHDLSGWLIYVLILAMLGGLTFFLCRFFPHEPHSEGTSGSSEQSLGRMQQNLNLSPWISLAIISVLILSMTAQSVLADSQVQPVRKSFADFPDRIAEWRGKRHFLSQRILDRLWADDYLSAQYTHETTGHKLNLLISYYATQNVTKTAHAPTSCLVGSGWMILNKYLSPAQEETGRSFPVRGLLLQQGEQRMLANFWFEQRGRHITSEYLNKVYLLWDSLFMRRTDGALVRVELSIGPDQSAEEAQILVDDFVQELKDHLQSYVPGIMS